MSESSSPPPKKEDDTLESSPPFKPSSFFKYSPLDHAVAGITAGLVANLSLHPLDLIKIRLQVNDGIGTPRFPYTSTLSAAQSIFRHHGFKGLYQGATPNLCGGALAWGSYFFSYNTLKDFLKKHPSDPLGPVAHLSAATLAGAVTLLLTNPLWVIKTRMCLQVNKTHPKAYKSIFDAFRNIHYFEGFRGFYKGLFPGLLGVSHGGVQFAVYEELKTIFLKRNQKSHYERLTTFQYLFLASSSKIIATAVTYPYQVIRSRLQDQRHSKTESSVKYAGTKDCFQKIMKNEGILGFYKGLLPSLIRVLPATCIVFGIYETISHSLQEFAKNRDAQFAS